MRVDCFSCRPTKLTATNGASCARSWFIPTTALKNCYHGSMVLTSDSFGCIVGAFLTMPWARRPWLAMCLILWNLDWNLCLRSEACWRLTKHTSRSMESRYSLLTCWICSALNHLIWLHLQRCYFHSHCWAENTSRGALLFECVNRVVRFVTLRTHWIEVWGTRWGEHWDLRQVPRICSMTSVLCRPVPSCEVFEAHGTNETDFGNLAWTSTCHEQCWLSEGAPGTCETHVTQEMEIGITGGVEDGVDNSGAAKEKLYSTPQDVFNVYKGLNPISHMCGP